MRVSVFSIAYTFSLKSPNLGYFWPMQNQINEVNSFIQGEREALLSHPLYANIQTVQHLRKFTEGHVYAVWDFMSLLKALQIQLTCTQVPWFATDLASTRYLINEIVLAEESDEYVDGRRLSHYEMYLDAMERLGADIKPIEQLVEALKAGRPVLAAISDLEIDERIKDFLRFTFETIESKEPHKIAAAFTFGREDLIPDMFSSILGSLKQQFPEEDLDRLIYYFQRHIELDGDEHGPLAMKMIMELGGDDAQKWEEMKTISKEALEKRIGLWDAIAASL